MNLLNGYYKFSNIIVRFILYLFFRCVQNMLWILSYNSNGNTFVCKGRCYNCKIKITGGGNTLIINNKVRMENININITGNNNYLYIGSGTRWEECGNIRIEDCDNSILIGNNCDFRGCFFTCSDKNTKIKIGDDCLFSANVVIRTSDSHSIVDSEGERLNPGKDVTIGNHVWIGNGAVILKGSVIENNCVIGTNTVISGKQLNSGCIAVGNPAKIVKDNINWMHDRIY